jgi:hypothetical protein
MRVGMRGGLVPTTCQNDNDWGEFEDYTIEVVEPTVPIACDRPTSVVGTHNSGNEITVCWNPGDPGIHADKVQLQIRRKPNQPGCPSDNANRLADPANAPGNCVHVPFNVGNCDCVYQARARYRCTDGQFSNWKFDVSIPTSCGNVRVGNPNRFQSFSIYPNPAWEKLNLDYVPWDDGYIDIAIFDVFGRILIKEKHAVAKGDNLFIFDIESYSPGIYLIQIQEGDEKHVQKFTIGG